MELIRKHIEPGSTSKYLRVLAVAALAMGSTMAQADIVGSKHDLSTGGSAQQTTAATGEVCVFCHTPHGSNTNAAVPLWNKALTTDAGGNATYNRYSSLNTSTLDGSEALVGSVSIACLSCHDGTQAMDVVINAPGSGNYVATGSEIDGTNIGVMTGTPIPNLGTDLTNDHPISIQYAGGGCNATTPACTTLGDADFNSPSTASINTVQVWWVDTGGAGRQKTDLQLYSRQLVAGTGDLEPFVECGSCHDPHEATPRPVSFMRISNDNSAVCTACHVK